MNRIVIIGVITSCFAINCSLGAQFNPGERVEEQITVEYNSSEEAKQAQLTPLELPAGKTRAISSRWDDSNADSKKVSQALAENGWKGTFFINSCSDEFYQSVIKNILADNNSIGAHTTTHPSLQICSPNYMFREIMENRIELERKTDSSVIAFTFPNGMHPSITEPDALNKMGIALKKAGFMGLSEPTWSYSKLNLTPEQLVTCKLLTANDRNPQQSVFDASWSSAENELKAGRMDQCGPYFVLGMHPWQGSAENGFETFSKILASQSHNPQYWYCTANEYIAYCTNYLYIKPIKVFSDGDLQTRKYANDSSKSSPETLRFSFSRIQPCVLGANVPTGFKISPLPKSVKYNNQTIAVSREGEFMISKIDSPKALPITIDRVDNPDNKTENSVLKSGKIPGIETAIFVDIKANRLFWQVRNTSDKPLEDLCYSIRLPLKWRLPDKSAYVISNQIPPIAPGETFICHLNPSEAFYPLPEIDTDPLYQDADLFITAELNFCRENQRFRLYSTTTVSQPPVKRSVPRDTALCVGAVESSKIGNELQSMSIPKTPLKPIELKKDQQAQWMPVSQNSKFAPYTIAVDNCKPVREPAIAYAMEFENSDTVSTPFTLEYTWPHLKTTVWINGTKYDQKPIINFNALPGKNRVIILYEDYRIGYIKNCIISIKNKQGEFPAFTEIEHN